MNLHANYRRALPKDFTMGFAKREGERRDQMEAVATAIAVELGALNECEVCEDIKDPLAGMEEEVTTEALERFRNQGDGMDVFKDEAEVTSAVADAFANTGEECQCSQNKDD